MIASSELVVFAIKAGIRLGQQARLAYVDSTRRRKLTIPLPDVVVDGGFSAALNYFADAGRDFVIPGSSLAELNERAADATVPFSNKDEQLLVEHYRRCRRFEKLSSGDGQSSFDQQAFVSVLAIEQWAAGAENNPSALQRVLGTIVEVGIDYFASGPGMIDKTTKHGRVVAGLVDAVDGIKFAELDLSDVRLQSVVGRLLISALETVSEDPVLLTGHAQTQELITVLTGGLLRDVSERMKDADSLEEMRILDWTELVLRSTLTGAGSAIVENPGRYLGVEKESKQKLITSVGSTLLGVVLNEDDLQLENVFSRESLDGLARAALDALSEHPELLSGDSESPWNSLFKNVTNSIYQYEDNLVTLEIFPEIARIVLEKTGENLELIWPELKTRPEKHLLLTTMRTALAVLTEPDPNAPWSPRFTGDDLIQIAELLADEVVGNPKWLMAINANANDALGKALSTVVGVLREQEGPWLTRAVAVEVIGAVIQAMALRQEFLEKFTGTGGQPLVAAIVDLLLATLFDPALDPAIGWQVVRQDVVVMVVRVVLQHVNAGGIGDSTMATLESVLDSVIGSQPAGKPIDWIEFANALETQLAA